MANARRKFEDAYKQSKNKTTEKVLYYMRKLYATEDMIRSQEYLKKGLIEKIVEIRQKESKPNSVNIWIMAISISITIW